MFSWCIAGEQLCLDVLDVSDTSNFDFNKYHDFSLFVSREPSVLRLLLNKAIFGLVLWLKEEESKQQKETKGKVVTTLSLCV